MARKVDTVGKPTEAPVPVDPSAEVSALKVEIPLWRFGRITFESRSQKASLAVVALGLLTVLLVVLALIEATPGDHPGTSALIGHLSQAVMLVLGVLLGVNWKAGRKG
jgi:hypothetical protein